MGTVFSSPAELLGTEPGRVLGSSDWLEITQKRISQFADATGDHQWIHVDPERAKEGPYGACIAHGYLTLSLVNLFLPEICKVENSSMGINYGCNRVRFPAPVPAGSRVRGSGALTEVDEVKGGVQAVVRVTVELENSERPACVADTVSRFYF